ncbi:MAG: MerR family transcriptional regulator [Coprobacillaceae bacterium]
MRIGDFSKLTKVSVRMLRYYDKEGLLKPEMIDPITGHRIYAVDQVSLLQKIIMLRDLNFSITEIRQIVNHWDKEYLLQHMQGKLKEIYDMIETEKKRAIKIEEAINHIQLDEIETHYNVTLKEVPELTIISLRRKVESHFEEEKLWNELYAYVSKHHITIDQTRYNNLAIYHDEHLEESLDIEVAYIVKDVKEGHQDIQYRTLEAVTYMASMMVYGPYENLEKAYASFVQWLLNHTQYSIGSTSRQITIVDYRHTDNPKEYLTEIQIPLYVIEAK